MRLSDKTPTEKEIIDYIKVLKKQELALDHQKKIPSLDSEFLKLQDHYRSGKHEKDLKKVFGE